MSKREVYKATDPPSDEKQPTFTLVVPFQHALPDPIIRNGNSGYTNWNVQNPCSGWPLEEWFLANFPKAESIKVKFCIAESFAGVAFSPNMEKHVRESVQALVTILQKDKLTDFQLHFSLTWKFSNFDEADDAIRGRAGMRIKRLFKDEAAIIRKPKPEIVMYPRHVFEPLEREEQDRERLEREAAKAGKLTERAVSKEVLSKPRVRFDS